MNKELKMWVLGHKVSPQKLSANYDMAIGESQPGIPGPPPHRHKGYHESFYIIGGEMDFTINGEFKKFKRGETVEIPPHTLHTFTNSGNKVCKWLNIHSPKGFSEFFKQYGIPEKDPDAMKRSIAPEIIQEVLIKASEYDMNIE